jgi:hypothetical protein
MLTVPAHPPVIRLRCDMFVWYERKMATAGAIGAGAAAWHAERVFFLPDMDATQPIAEGPSPADWTGYHAGKHGVYERFTNLKGESVTLGELFYNEKYRWVRPEYLKNPNELKLFTETEFQAKLDAAYANAPRQTTDLSGLFDSNKFTADVKTQFDRFRADPKSTVWQGRYIYRGGGLGELQTNVDFEYQGSKYRIAVDAKTGKALNFFRIEENPKFGPMKFSEIALRWKGKVTDVQVHAPPGSTITVEISATWTGLFKQGLKSGAISGAIVAAFFGAISGFKKEGLVGALKGLAIGVVMGGAAGAAVGGVVTLASRVFPVIGVISKTGGLLLSVVGIILDASDTALEPPEWTGPRTDADGNIWRYRHIEKVGTLFPEYIPHGIRIDCTDGTILEFGDNEYGAEASYDRRLPILVYAGSKRLKWHMSRTPQGSTMWWWQDQDTLEEFSVAYESDAVMFAETARQREEAPFRFVLTQN